MAAINSRMILIFFAISLVNPLAQSGTDKEYRTVCVPDSVLHDEILGCYLDEFSASDKKLNIIDLLRKLVDIEPINNAGNQISS